MALIVKNNMSAINTLNTLNRNHTALSKSLAKVSSGMRINGAADDASGYAISERMRVQIRSLDQANRNTQNGNSMMRTAEGAVSSTVEILKTLKEKVINAANDTNTDADRATIQKELNQSIDQIDDNANVTYNGKYLVDGSKQTIGNATYTSLTNQSLDVGTTANTKLTDLKARNGDDLNLASTDKVTVSYVMGGKTHSTTFEVGDNDLQEIFNKAEAMEDTKVFATAENESVATATNSNPGTVTTAGLQKLYDKLHASTTAGTGELAIEAARATAEQTAAQTALGDASTNATGVPITNTTDGSMKALLLAADAIDHTATAAALGNSTANVTNAQVEALMNTTSMQNALKTNASLQAKYDAYKADVAKVEETTAAATAATNAVTDANAVKNLINSELTASRSNDALTGAANGLADMIATVASSNGISFDKEAFLSDVAGQYAALSTTITGTTDVAAMKTAYDNTKTQADTDKTAFNTAKTTFGTTATDSQKALYDKLRKSIEGPKVITGSDIGLAASGDKVSTADGKNAITITANTAGVHGQIAGFNINITDSEGNVKKSANAALDAFEETIRAVNKSDDNAITLQVGSKANQSIKVGLTDMRSEALGLKGQDGTKLNISTQVKANAAVNVLENALQKALDQQTTIGSIQSRLDYTSSNLTAGSENVQASESTIRDADMAKEMTEYTKNNVLLQAAQSMLSQANQNSSAVLSLLQ